MGRKETCDRELLNVLKTGVWVLLTFISSVSGPNNKQIRLWNCKNSRNDCKSSDAILIIAVCWKNWSETGSFYPFKRDRVAIRSGVMKQIASEYPSSHLFLMKECRYCLFFLMENKREILKPKRISPCGHVPNVSDTNVRSVMPGELVKWSWNTCPPVSISNPSENEFVVPAIL